MRAPCSNCGDQWLLPVRGLTASPLPQLLNAGIHKTGFQWPPKHLNQMDTVTLLGK